MRFKRLENPAGVCWNWPRRVQSRSVPATVKIRATYAAGVHGSAMGDGREAFRVKAERRSSTTIASPPPASAGRNSLKSEPAVPKGCVEAEESRHRRTTARPLATRDAPAHRRARNPADRDGESVGTRIVRRAVVVPSTTAAWRC